MVMLHRAAFLDLTIVTCALYMLANAYKINSFTFRGLVIAILGSLFYDFFWFGMKSSEYSSAAKDDGGLEGSLRSFVLNLSYCAFFFKIIIGAIYWKNSLDF
mmetsp:Transcript_47364/g.34666  ORF Transcript_47364/g.34666 Transcript_47364/m.34666 type:complete len:102 (-) Transcript_47364:165-470(-)